VFAILSSYRTGSWACNSSSSRHRMNMELTRL
jgi:hypothetical protein